MFLWTYFFLELLLQLTSCIIGQQAVTALSDIGLNICFVYLKITWSQMAHIPKTLQSHTVCSIVDALLTITLQVIPSRFISYEAGDADGLYSIVNFPLVLLVLLRMISWMVSVGSRRRTSPRALWTWWEFIAWRCFCSSASVSAHLDTHLSKSVSVCDVFVFFVFFTSLLLFQSPESEPNTRRVFTSETNGKFCR